MTCNHRRPGLLAAGALFAALISGCSAPDNDPNNQIPITMDGWRDLRIGAPFSTLEPHIDDNTIDYTFPPCTSYQILADTPRAMAVIVDDSTMTIAEIRIGGVSGAKTKDGLGLGATLQDVRDIPGSEATYIPNEEYTGSEVRKSNMGDLVIDWADPQHPGTASDPSRGIRYETWRSSDSLASIAVGDYLANGDTVCD